ncbi:MAG: CAP domain-containing protein [Oscillospiraceae bacterium]|jgi:uncharacterized YkwD family protein|nr:CAP domain-containing protein [Oscillospiraceae bacterium]
MNFKLLAIIASLIVSLTAGGVALTQAPAKPTSESTASSACTTNASSCTATQPISQQSTYKVGSTTASVTTNCNASQKRSGCPTASNASKPTSSQVSHTHSQPSSSASVTSSPSSASTSHSSSVQSSSAVSAQTSSGYAAFQNEVLTLVNQQRTANGLRALSANAQLMKTATLKSEDMAKLNYFDHTSPTYGSPFDMMKQFGISYRTAGENIAMGQTSPEQVMNGWMNSEGHRKNILNAAFTQIGIGIAQNANGQYIWTQQFIG